MLNCLLVVLATPRAKLTGYHRTLVMKTLVYKSLRHLLVVSTIAIFSVNLILAQSGRRAKTPVPTPSPQVSEPADSKAVEEPITYIIIGGHNIDPDTKEMWSTDVSTVVKACTERLKEPPQ